MNLARDTVVGTLDRDTQLELVEQVREVCRLSPLVRPTTPNGLIMSVRITNAGELGWAGGSEYHYAREDSRGQPWPRMPRLWSDIASFYAGYHPWDSAIVNWYPPGSSLGLHKDKSEYNQSLPIVTISLGDACSWAVRLDLESPVSRCQLDTGDVTLLAGPTRGALHSVERIIDAPLLSPLQKRGRISITMRVAGRVDVIEVAGTCRLAIVEEQRGWWSATPIDHKSWVAWTKARSFPGTVEQFMSVSSQRGFPLGQIRRQTLTEIYAGVAEIMGLTSATFRHLMWESVRESAQGRAMDKGVPSQI